jgi:hypothetical protein
MSGIFAEPTPRLAEFYERLGITLTEEKRPTGIARSGHPKLPSLRSRLSFGTRQTRIIRVERDRLALGCPE